MDGGSERTNQIVIVTIVGRESAYRRECGVDGPIVARDCAKRVIVRAP